MGVKRRGVGVERRGRREREERGGGERGRREGEEREEGERWRREGEERGGVGVRRGE